MSISLLVPVILKLDFRDPNNLWLWMSQYRCFFKLTQLFVGIMNYDEDLFHSIIMKICNTWLLPNSSKLTFSKFNKILIRHAIKVLSIIPVPPPLVWMKMKRNKMQLSLMWYKHSCLEFDRVWQARNRSTLTSYTSSVWVRAPSQTPFLSRPPPPPSPRSSGWRAWPHRASGSHGWPLNSTGRPRFL